MRTCCSAAERLGAADPGRVFPAFALAAGAQIFGENRLIIESASLNLKYPFGLRFYGFRQALAATSVASNLTRFLNSEKATRKSLRASTTSAAVVLIPLSRWAR